MTRNILDLTKKPSLSSNNLLATNPSSNNNPASNSSQNRLRKPLPIIEPRTGKEVIVELDPFHHNFDRNTAYGQSAPPHNLPASPSQSKNSPKNLRKPLLIINPKTGEIVTNPVVSSPAKRAIPIINPKTGTELENIQARFHESQNPDQSPNANIIKTPFTVVINRPQSVKRTPNVLHSTYPMQNAQISIPNSRPSKQSHIFQSDYSNNIWSKSRQSHEWPMSLTGSHSDSHSLYPSTEIEEEEEEAEFEKYDWTPCIGYGMSFFDDEDHVVCQGQRVLGLNGVTVW